MRAVLRRRGDADDVAETALESGPVRMDVDRHVVTVRGRHGAVAAEGVRTAPGAAAQLGPGADQDAAHRPGSGAPDYVGDTKTLDVHIKRLRAKIELDPARPQHIVTVRGLGYKFESAA